VSQEFIKGRSMLTRVEGENLKKEMRTEEQLEFESKDQ
jgi:hypothetical protein